MKLQNEKPPVTRGDQGFRGPENRKFYEVNLWCRLEAGQKK